MSLKASIVGSLLAAPLLALAVRAETAPSAPAGSIYRVFVSGAS